MPRTKPVVVLVFGGNDPTGGAGLAADIAAIAAMGGHACPVVTAITVQDTRGVHEFQAVDDELVIAQARVILEDMDVTAIKTGMLGSVRNLAAIADLLEEYQDIPLIVDPVLTSGRGDTLSSEPIEEAYRQHLLSQATLITPNSIEARHLAPEADTLDACAHGLLSTGCQFLLITGTHENNPQVIHRLFGDDRLIETYTMERLPGNYHGSGCTLASACAVTIGQGLEIAEAVREAQNYTYNALKNGFRLGMGQVIPDRLYWAFEDDDSEKPEDTVNH